MLGIDKSLIVLAGGARRTTVNFQIHGSPEEIARASAALSDTVSLAADLSAQLAASHNISVLITVAPPSAVEDSTSGAKAGEVWEEVDGQYVLRYS